MSGKYLIQAVKLDVDGERRVELKVTVSNWGVVTLVEEVSTGPLEHQPHDAEPDTDPSPSLPPVS